LFYLNKFRKFYDEHKQQFLKEEHEHFNRLITFLNENLVPENQESLRKDSDIFFAQYSQRRKKAINFAQQIGLK
jgi:hypothetical protein